MSRAIWLGSGLAVFAAAILLWRLTEFSGVDHTPFEPPSRVGESSPLCPWREPEADLQRFFPGANRHQTETRILSGLRVELARQLGRQPGAEENALTFHRVYHGSQRLGAVLTSRVKGEHGAIELVVAVNEKDEVRGARLQRLREPATIAAAVQGDEWLRKFQGRTHEQGWENDDLRSVPEEARASARSIREGIRSLLVLLAASESPRVPSAAKPHH